MCITLISTCIITIGMCDFGAQVGVPSISIQVGIPSITQYRILFTDFSM